MMLSEEKEILKNVMAFRPSIGKWYKRTCDYSGEVIITNYPPTAKFPIYKSKYFYQDVRTPIALEYDANKSFFAQLAELQQGVPRPHMLGATYENCDYCDDVWNSKNCFLSSSMLECENIFYCYRTIRCKDAISLVSCYDCQLCYRLTYSFDCYKVAYGFGNRNCTDSYFLYDCRNVNYCTMCRNLRHKEYCILNKQYTKEEYFAKLQEYDFGSRSAVQGLQRIRQYHLQNDALHPEHRNEQTEMSSGNYLVNGKNLKNCFIWEDSEDCDNCFRGLQNKSSKDCGGLLQGELCTLINQSSYLYKVTCASYCDNCKHSAYIDNCSHCEYCFGCVGLKNKQYHIFNKAYEKAEYERLVAEIKDNMKKSGEWGRFFPYNMMYCGYNTTVARLFFPDTKEHIQQLGGYREDEITHTATPVTRIGQLPDHINEVDERIATLAFQCVKTGQLYNISPQALAVYKKLGVPLPDVTYLENIIEQYQPLSWRKSYEGICSITGQRIMHYYPPTCGYKKIVAIEAYEKLVL